MNDCVTNYSNYIIPLLTFLAGYYTNKKFEKDKQVKDREKEYRDVNRTRVKEICALVDEIVDNSKDYWLSSIQERRISLSKDLKYKLKKLGPHVQNLYHDDLNRRRSVLLLKLLRQHIMQGDFEYPKVQPLPDQRAVDRIIDDAAKLQVHVRESTNN